MEPSSTLQSKGCSPDQVTVAPAERSCSGDSGARFGYSQEGAGLVIHMLYPIPLSGSDPPTLINLDMYQ